MHQLEIFFIFICDSVNYLCFYIVYLYSVILWNDLIFDLDQ